MVRLAVIALSLLGAGCSSLDTVAFGQGGQTDDPDAGPRPEYCESDGPPLPLVGDGLTIGEDGDGNPTCSGEIAVYTFQKALCTCDRYVASVGLVTESFDSDRPAEPEGTEAPVGIGGVLQANAKLEIGGDLIVAGTDGAQFGSLAAGSSVAGDLLLNGPLGAGATSFEVDGDAAVNGDISLTGLSVKGTLTTPADAVVAAGVVAGQRVSAPVSVDAPCACGEDDLVDIQAFVEAHRETNDNPEVPPFEDGTVDASGNPIKKTFTAGALAGNTGNPVITLPCGRFFLSGIAGPGKLTLKVTGRAALLIAGTDVSLDRLSIVLETPEAELDLMIAGTLSIASEATIGQPEQPRRTRIYVDGPNILFKGLANISANIYAPRASFDFEGGGIIYGSLFAGQFSQSAALHIRYDVAVRRLDTNCIE
jgi:hypothetical protein